MGVCVPCEFQSLLVEFCSQALSRLTPFALGLLGALG